MSTRGRSVFRRDVLRHGLLGLATLAGCSGNDSREALTKTRAFTPDWPVTKRRKPLTGEPAVDGGSSDAGADGDIGAGGDASHDAASGGEGADRDATTPRLGSKLAAVRPLGAADENGVRLPPGFSSRVIATTGTAPVSGKSYLWHAAPDGGAVYPAPDGGWVYVSNGETIPGGAGALRFDAHGELVDAYSILRGSRQNCAGGATPWGTWLSCEEVLDGVVFECDPFGVSLPVPRPALGRFTHEAVTVDPILGHLYLTEDCVDGRFYRFTPAATGGGAYDLSGGTLAVALVNRNGEVTWHDLPDPEFVGAVDTRYQVPKSTPFNGGEGVVYFNGIVFVSTKGDDRIWAYDTRAQTMRVFYDRATTRTPILSGVDNMTVTTNGDVLVAEDAGDMQIVAILEDGSLKPLLQVLGQNTSELTGLAFDPSGTRLYFSSQRGTGAGGITYEITGPFHVIR